MIHNYVMCMLPILCTPGNLGPVHTSPVELLIRLINAPPTSKKLIGYKSFFKSVCYCRLEDENEEESCSTCGEKLKSLQKCSKCKKVIFVNLYLALMAFDTVSAVGMYQTTEYV